MCGILGISSKNSLISEHQFRASLEMLHHRGPDNTGVIYDKELNLALGLKRLSIIDLSANGSQPMEDQENRIQLIFNGEIYNYKELRKDLEKLNHEFTSASDTEVLLHGYTEWGKDLFEKLSGMFAFAIVDKLKNEIVLVRDRAGEKPLFYSILNGELFFSSEIKPLINFPGLSKDINPLSLNQLFEFGYTPRSSSIFRDIRKLAPGTTLTFNLKTREHIIEDYWEISERILKTNLKLNVDESIEKNLVSQLEGLLEKSVNSQLNADVPIGIFLSGGMDSSLITAIASRLRDKINTFTVIFSHYKKFDESSHARLVANTFATNHHELEANSINPAIIDELTYFFDEPMFDSSMIPTYLLSKTVSSSCKVALTGDGGDELFGGYPHYNKLLRLRKISNYIPIIIRKGVSSVCNNLLPIGFRGKKTIELLSSDFVNSYPNIAEFFSNSDRKELFNNSKFKTQKIDTLIESNVPVIEDYISRATFSDFQNYLSEDLLVKVDRASMANSLEIRSPFLDREIIEFSFLNLPSSLKVEKNERKIILKKLAEKILPPTFQKDRKQGFSLPLGSFLLEEDWYDYFHQKIIDSDQDIFNHKAILKLLNSKYRIDQNAERLFAIVLFMCWVKRFNPSF